VTVRVPDLTGHFEALAESAGDGRPWPAPEHGWIAGMRWEQVLFLSWPVPEEAVRKLVPDGLELDLHEGQAYISVLPLRMVRVHLRDVPPIPHLDDFPELNLRTYVTRDGRPGVWFLSLDAPRPLFDWLARHLFHQPYFRADVVLKTARSGQVGFSSRRHADHAPPTRFQVRYTPIGQPEEPKERSLERFLCERYAMYAMDHEGRIRRGDIHHSPWQIRQVKLDPIEVDGFLEAAGVRPRGAEVAFYSDRTDTVVWRLVDA
jgi:uncharacterized protein YqjF (DUF2071 family)